MAALGSQTIASSYEQLLHVDTDGGGNTTTLVPIKDGDNGTTFCLQIATTSALIEGSGSKLYFSDAGGEYISGNGSILSIAGGNEIDLTATDIDINGAANISGALVIGGDVSMTQAGQAILHVNSTGDAAQLKLSALSGGSNYEWSIYSNNAADQFLIVDGSATRLVIDSAGKVGIGTTSPDYILELEHSNTTAVAQNLGQGINIHNTAGLNAISSLTFTGADHNGDGCLSGIYAKHVNVTENSEESELHFVTTASETLVEAMTIDGSGNVGIGTTEPGYQLDLRKNDTGTTASLGIRQLGSGDASMAFQTTTSPYGFCIGVDGSDSDAFKIATGLTDVGTNTKITITTAGYINAPSLNQTGSTSNRYPLYWVHTGTTGSIEPYTGSVRAMKTDIADMGTVDWIHSLTPRSFKFRDFEDIDGVRTYKDTTNDNPIAEYGLIAEEVDEVSGSDYILDKNSDGELKGVLYHNLVPILLKAVQELSTANDALKSRIEALENA